MGNEQALAKTNESSIVAGVQKRVHALVSDGQLALPEGYHAGTALQAAMLELRDTVTKDRKPVLQACDRHSIAASLLYMVVQGLSPQRKQCYFVAYGKKLTCMRSYFGSISLAQRIVPGLEIPTATVWKGDEFEVLKVGGRDYVSKHKTSVDNWTNKVEDIRASYALLEYPGGEFYHGEMPPAVIRTLDQIKAAWKRGKGYVEGKAGTTHDEHPQDMAEKTAAQAACKKIINTADDSYLAKLARDADQTADELAVAGELGEQANTGDVIDFDDDALEADVVVTEEDDPVSDDVDASNEVQEQEVDDDFELKSPEADPAGPEGRWLDMLGANDMSETRAKIILAKMCGIDSSELEMKHFAKAVQDWQTFESVYRGAEAQS